MEQGIYLGLPEDEYHANPALGSTAIKQLFEDPVEWQYQNLLGEEMHQTPAMLLGSAIHKRLLEGRDAFEGAYYRKLTPDDVENPLVTVDDLKERLRALALPLGGKKPDLIDRVHKADPDAVIWDVEKQLYDEESAHKTELNEEHMRRVELAAEWCQADHLLRPFMRNGTFNLGIPEVSVFTEIDGVKVKQRIDLLLPGKLVDLKSFSPMMNKEPIYALPYAIRKFGHDLQAGHYENVFEAAKGLPIFGADPAQETMIRQTLETEPDWVWVFCKTIGAPQVYVEPFNRHLTAYANARRDAREAIATYSAHVDKYGLDEQWVPHHQPFNFGDSELLRG